MGKTNRKEFGLQLVEAGSGQLTYRKMDGKLGIVTVSPEDARRIERWLFTDSPLTLSEVCPLLTANELKLLVDGEGNDGIKSILNQQQQEHHVDQPTKHFRVVEEAQSNVASPATADFSGSTEGSTTSPDPDEVVIKSDN